MVGYFIVIHCRKLRIIVQPTMQKARMVEQKTQRNFVDSHESSVGGSV